MGKLMEDREGRRSFGRGPPAEFEGAKAEPADFKATDGPFAEAKEVVAA